MLILRKTQFSVYFLKVVSRDDYSHLVPGAVSLQVSINYKTVAFVRVSMLIKLQTSITMFILRLLGVVTCSLCFFLPCAVGRVHFDTF